MTCELCGESIGSPNFGAAISAVRCVKKCRRRIKQKRCLTAHYIVLSTETNMSEAALSLRISIPLSSPDLIDMALARGEGVLSDTGALRGNGRAHGTIPSGSHCSESTVE